jgi:hypothetical protein
MFAWRPQRVMNALTLMTSSKGAECAVKNIFENSAVSPSVTNEVPN